MTTPSTAANFQAFTAELKSIGLWEPTAGSKNYVLWTNCATVEARNAYVAKATEVLTKCGITFKMRMFTSKKYTHRGFVKVSVPEAILIDRESADAWIASK